MLLQKIIQELQHIPEDKLADLYRVIYFFRIGISQQPRSLQSRSPRTSGLLQGKLGGAFFDPLPEEELRL
jgi:hypothetical protein